MSVFDLTLHVVASSAEAREPEEGQPHVAVSCTVALPLPTPQGMIGIPIGNMRYLMDKADAIKHAEGILEEAHKLPDPSNLAVASDMQSVSNMAEEMKRVTGTP